MIRRFRLLLCQWLSHHYTQSVEITPSHEIVRCKVCGLHAAIEHRRRTVDVLIDPQGRAYRWEKTA